MDIAKIKAALTGFLSVSARIDGMIVIAFSTAVLAGGTIVEAVLCSAAILYGAKKVVIG